MTTTGTVIKSTGSWYKVRTQDSGTFDCRIRGKFRLQGLPLTNPVAVGDQVDFEKENETEGIIKKIHPRTNYVARQSPRKKHQLHLLASNVDQAILIITLVEPNLKQGFIDRFLLMTEPRDIPVVLVFNKADLYSDDDLSTFDFLREIYVDLVDEILLVSAKNGDHIEELAATLSGKTSLIGGQSGVGKSTLVNRIAPHLTLKTQDLSNHNGKGQHTTTFAEMFALDEDSFIIDTPGIKTLSFNNLEPLDIAHNFREVFEASKHCRFNNCLHRQEPQCHVRRMIEEGAISELRYFNYITLLEEAEEQNYWERKNEY